MQRKYLVVSAVSPIYGDYSVEYIDRILADITDEDDTIGWPWPVAILDDGVSLDRLLDSSISLLVDTPAIQCRGLDGSDLSSQMATFIFDRDQDHELVTDCPWCQGEGYGENLMPDESISYPVCEQCQGRGYFFKFDDISALAEANKHEVLVDFFHAYDVTDVHVHRVGFEICNEYDMCEDRSFWRAYLYRSFWRAYLSRHNTISSDEYWEGEAYSYEEAIWDALRNKGPKLDELVWPGGDPWWEEEDEEIND